MNNFIIIGLIVFVLSAYLGVKLYRDMSFIFNAKRIQEQFKKDSFWKKQEFFEE
jgi:hypothetical protein